MIPKIERRFDSTAPRFGDAALAADLIASLGAALSAVLDGGEHGEMPRRPIVAALEQLAEGEHDVSPETVLSADLADIADDVLTELRVRLFEAGACRMQLAGALGARLALRAIDAT